MKFHNICKKKLPGFFVILILCNALIVYGDIKINLNEHYSGGVVFW